MTRFFVRTNVEESEKLLCNLMEKLGSSWKIHTPGVVSFSTSLKFYLISTPVS